MVVRLCAPTLACVKTGSLFSTAFASDVEMYGAVRRLNRLLGKSGIRVLPLRWRDGHALIYLYRPSQLERDLKNALARQLLRECGYACETPCQALRTLINRLSDYTEFPHEIGLFLGYPPKDVEGFMHRRGEFVLCGRWKVYDDPQTARAMWSLCDHCTANCLKRLEAGCAIETLAISS